VLSMKLCCAKMVHRLGFRVSFQAVLDAREVLLELIYHTVCNKSAKVTARVDGGLSHTIDKVLAAKKGIFGTRNYSL